ncbi:hypothetical protein C8J57DRAFT_1238433 [Mycena rebaudengoi]|nr:hypothetical protein C8J57DRAFT_1238433 [Mycena rebaudengoi]
MDFEQYSLRFGMELRLSGVQSHTWIKIQSSNTASGPVSRTKCFHLLFGKVSSHALLPIPIDHAHSAGRTPVARVERESGSCDPVNCLGLAYSYDLWGEDNDGTSGKPTAIWKAASNTASAVAALVNASRANNTVAFSVLPSTPITEDREKGIQKLKRLKAKRENADTSHSRRKIQSLEERVSSVQRAARSPLASIKRTAEELECEFANEAEDREENDESKDWPCLRLESLCTSIPTHRLKSRGWNGQI